MQMAMLAAIVAWRTGPAGATGVFRVVGKRIGTCGRASYKRGMSAPRLRSHRFPCAAALPLVAALWLAGCAGPAPQAGSTPAAPTVPAPATPSAAETNARAEAAARQLRSLMDASDEAMLARNPMAGLFRGDLRRAGEFGNPDSPAHVAAEREAAQTELNLLDAVSREALNADDRAAYDSFRWSRQLALEANAMPLAGLWPLMPLDQMQGWHLLMADISSAQGPAPYRSVADYDAGLSRLQGFIVWLDGATDRMQQGMASGVVLPKVVVARLIAQFDQLATQGVNDSPFYGPVRQMPADLPAADRERLTRETTELVEDQLRPALARMSRFLTTRYLPAARDSVGLSALPGGGDYYAWLIRLHTTTGLDAATVHRLGLSEVARIEGGMQAVMREVGFAGSLGEFFEQMRTDPRFAPASAQALADGYAAIGQRVAQAMPRLFGEAPRTPLVIRPTPDYQAVTAAGASYTPGSLDTGQPGIFHFNTHDLPSRRTWGMETLYLHEAVPGHHYQGSLAAENTALPKQQRFDGNTAYAEGWALYAESLGPELGLFTDPYQRFGHYNDEMLRAIRLVVDTGLHAFGWSREQAIDYLLAHSALSRTEATAEVERYIAMPGQALAYKVGALTLQQLRLRAQQALGPRFDLKAFHRQVLDAGALPMLVLTARIDDWIAAQQPR